MGDIHSFAETVTMISFVVYRLALQGIAAREGQFRGRWVHSGDEGHWDLGGEGRRLKRLSAGIRGGVIMRVAVCPLVCFS